jgi:hypothetical protein
LSKTYYIIKYLLKILYFIKKLVRKIGRTELAEHFQCSLDSLRYQINKHKELRHLKKTRVFYTADLNLIFKYIGEPQYFDSIDEDERLKKEKKDKQRQYDSDKNINYD